MPEDPEVPIEHLQEAAEHELHGDHGQGHGGPGLRWNSLAALSAAVFAVLAAISSLFAGHDANEAMLEQIRGSDGYAFYQAKGIKASVLESKVEMLSALGRQANDSDRPTIERYRKEQEEIKAEADREVASSRKHMSHHAVLARSVTFFQVAIALAATAVLTKKRSLWGLSLILGLGGAAFLVASVA